MNITLFMENNDTSNPTTLNPAEHFRRNDHNSTTIRLRDYLDLIDADDKKRENLCACCLAERVPGLSLIEHTIEEEIARRLEEKLITVHNSIE